MSRLRLVFMGSPEFAVPSLQTLAGAHKVLAVVTQPDKQKGRGLALAPPPVKSAAQELGLPVMQPERLRQVQDELSALAADLFVVVAYGKILSAKSLAIPRLGCINLHASLLPRYRGAAPIHWAVVGGERRSGVTIMLMDQGMDTGPTLLRREVELSPRETAGSLHDRLAPLGAAALLEGVEGFASGRLEPVPQPEEGACLAPMLTKEHGRVDFSRAAPEVDSLIRGLDPWPGAFTSLGCERLRLFGSQVVAGQSGAPGEVLVADKRGLLVACGEGAVRIEELQLAGKKRMSASALLAGRPISTGTRLGESP